MASVLGSAPACFPCTAVLSVALLQPVSSRNTGKVRQDCSRDWI